MKVITGVAGFIGSCMLAKLNQQGIEDVVIVDDFSREDRTANYQNKQFLQKIDREQFPQWFRQNATQVEVVFHLGARSSTTGKDWETYLKLNLNYTKTLWEICAENDIAFIYASSAATYGDGECGYDDDISLIDKLKPLNLYGKSKQDFDLWQLKQEKRPSFWAGLKFFNVYGPNEYHKGRMASVVLHAFEQIQDKGKVGLFKSYKQGYEDGWQLRDFVYVKDVVDVMYFLYTQRPKSDIYNIGTGQARSFYDLVANTFFAMGFDKANIEFIPMPEDIRDKYQYFTEAKMTKLQQAGYLQPFHTLEQGVKDYVQNYLLKKEYF